MGSLKRLLRLRAADRSLLFAALVALTATRVALWLCPVKSVNWIPRVASHIAAHRRRASGMAAAHACWAVERASRYVPGTACLTQALSAQLLLAWYGQEAVLRLGVARDPSGRIMGHAWLEQEGIVILGATDAMRYVPLATPGRGR